MIPLIDTHQHLWDLSRLKLQWIKGRGLLEHDHMMSDYLKAKEGTGIDSTVYMEVDADPNYWDREVADMTIHCKNIDTPMKALVIPGDPLSNDFGIYLEKHSKNPFVKGIRRVLQISETEPGLCLKPDFVEGVRKIGQSGLLFVICIRPAELIDAVTLVKQCPETSFVLDHCGNADPYIVNGTHNLITKSDIFGSRYMHSQQGWRNAISDLGGQKNVFCKISGIVARIRKGWDSETLAPTINACLDSFGSENVIFGGDWPVCRQGAELKNWVKAFREVLSRRDVAFQHKVMHQNAERIFSLSS